MLKAMNFIYKGSAQRDFIYFLFGAYYFTYICILFEDIEDSIIENDGKNTFIL